MTTLERLFMFSAARLGCCVVLLGVLAAFWQADPVFGGIMLDRSVFLLELGLIVAFLYAERRGRDVSQARRERTAERMRVASGYLLLLVGAGAISLSYHFVFGQDSHHREPTRAFLVFLPGFFALAALERATKESVDHAVSSSVRLPGIRDRRHTTLAVGFLGPALHYKFGLWFAEPAAGFVIGLILLEDGVRRLWRST